MTQEGPVSGCRQADSISTNLVNRVVLFGGVDLFGPHLLAKSFLH